MALLQVVVTTDCPSCGEARRLVEEARRRYPAVTIDVINLAQAPERLPASVFAVPTYLIDGRIVSLGTPADADLFRRIEAALGAGESPLSPKNGSAEVRW